jgi:redox-sensitive bicupin YhaK (pirin superfamily)
MASPVELVITGREANLGGATARRILPFRDCRMVGPFVFYDHLGPLTLLTNERFDVRPHPHIGLSTVTYLFSGEMVHRDSLGCVQSVRSGEVNWMTAGRGIVHSERMAEDDMHKRQRVLHGVQAWVALPQALEEMAPEFHNHARRELPMIEREGISARLIAGSAFGATSPVKTYTDMFYLDARIAAGQSLALPDEYAERAFYVAEGTVTLAGETYGVGNMVVLVAGAAAEIAAVEDATVMLLGGAPLDDEFIPLPE